MPTNHSASESSFPDRYKRFNWAMFIGLIILGTIPFFYLRLRYWSLTNEPPFSDMADYLNIAQNVLLNFNFDHNSFWRSYKPPTLPLVGAAVFGIFGVDLSVWRFLVSIFAAMSLIWLSYEVACKTGRAWFGGLLLLVVAFSRSSIFWSYKFSTEGLAELLSYLCAAYFLFCVRRGNVFHVLGLGIVTIATILNRPQFFPAAPLMGFLLLISPSLGPGSRAMGRKCVLMLCFFAGVFIGWTPWLMRSYQLYGHVVPLSTQGPYSFLWEVGDVKVRQPDGTEIVTNRQIIQDRATLDFPNDYEAQVYAQSVMTQWVRDHWRDYPAILLERFQRSINSMNVELTRVSREELGLAPFDSILFDKSFLAITAGGVGLLLLGLFVSPALLVLAFVSIGPWLFGLLFLGNARILDPSVPLLLYGNLAYVLIPARLFSAGHFRAFKL